MDLVLRIPEVYDSTTDFSNIEQDTFALQVKNYPSS